MSQKKDTEQKSHHRETFNKKRAEKFSRTYLLLLLLLISVLFFNVIKMFLVTILLAAVFTALFYPLYERFLKLTRNSQSISAILCCLVLLLGLLVPVYVLTDLVSGEANSLFGTAKSKISEIISKGDDGLLGQIKNYPLIKQLSLDTIDWQASLQDVAKNTANIIGKVINKTSRGTFQVLTDLFITLFIMFYFFRDGHKLTERLKYLSPLDDKHEDVLMSRFVSVSRATVKGTLLIGLTQGTLGGFTLWILGVASPILWGLVMVILSIIPLIGAWLVLIPAAIIQIILGHYAQGIILLAVTFVVINNVDTFLRPRLVGKEAGMHDLMIFFSTIGGIAMFGIMGFIIGPVIAAFFLTILDIYSTEFKATLDIAQGPGSQTFKETSSTSKEVKK